MKIEIKNLRHYSEMSQETNAFTCDLFVDGKKIGYCRNTGCGGPTDYYAFDGKKDILLSAEEYAKTLPDIEFEYNNEKHYFKSTLENFIDEEVEKQLKEKEDKKYAKKLQKDCEKSICYEIPNGYALITWKNYTIIQLLSTPIGIKTIQKKVDELKASGKIILNTNLVGIDL